MDSILVCMCYFANSNGRFAPTPVFAEHIVNREGRKHNQHIQLASLVGVAYNLLLMKQWRWIPRVFGLIPAIWLFFFLAVSSLVDDSPTMDEQNHVGRGVAFVHSGDPRLSLEHPPLLNGLAALPTLLMDDLHVPFEDSSWQLQPPDTYWYRFADQLLWQSGNDVSQLLFLARLPIVFLTLGLALVGFCFGRAVWRLPHGSWPFPAYLTFVFLLFDPNLMANGRYVTTDLGGTLFMFLATFLLWQLWQRERWDWRRWLWAGVGMGLAFGSKLSALGFVPIWGLMALLPLYQAGERFNWRLVGQRLLQLFTAGFFSILIVWLIFGLEWGAFRFQSEALIGFNQASGPMPTFWAGIEKILLLSSGGRGAYLLGNYSVNGFATYFPVAFLVKTPLPTLFGWVAALVVLLWNPATRRRALFLLLPPLLYFGAALQSSLNIGYRHLLPMLPFIYVMIGGLGSTHGGAHLYGRPDLDGNQRGGYKTRPYVGLFRLIPIGVGIGLVGVMLWIHPHYLGFFNWAAGGPQNGHNILLDSNIDWGQDLLRLQDWMDENEVERVQLGWFGTAVPAYYNLQYDPLPGFPQAEFLSLWTQPPFDLAAPAAGVYAISISNLMELPLPQSGVYAWFRQREPDARIGYSIWIYVVE